MPDLESRLPDLLRRAASGGRPDPDLERRVLRRARRRRVATASAAALAAVTVIAGVAFGAHELTLADRSTPADVIPSPHTATPIPAIWPEATDVGLADSQQRADSGQLDWRLDPAQTAEAFATTILGWESSDVEIKRTLQVPGSPVMLVHVANAGLGTAQGTQLPPAPETIVALDRLGDTGDRGVWSVIGADTDRIVLDPLTSPSTERPSLTGRLVDVAEEWQLGVWPIVGGQRLGSVTLVLSDPSGEFTTGLPLGEPVPAGGTIGILVGLWDPEGTVVVAEAFPFTVPAGGTGPAAATGSAGPTGATGPGGQIPSAVLASRDAIANAAETHDLAALEQLIGPDYSYNFSDGSAAVPAWRQDPAPLDTLAVILQMPPVPHTITDPTGVPVGSTYVWPGLVDADLSNLTQDERAMLDELGITDKDVKDMLDAFGGYVGPRAGIAEDGTWVFYTTGGD